MTDELIETTPMGAPARTYARRDGYAPTDLSRRAVTTARALTRLPDGEHIIRIVKGHGRFVIEGEGEPMKRWEFE